MADEPNNLDITSLPLEERQEMGFLGTPAETPEPAINAAGRPYDPATGRLLPAETPVEEPHDPNAQPTVTSQQKHSKDLYDAAAYFGMGPEDADAIAAPQLRKMLREMTRAHEAEQAALSRAKFWEDQRVANLPTQQRQQEQPQEEQFDLGGELDPQANPKTHALLQKMWEENRQLRKQVEEVGSTVKKQQATAFSQRVDRAIAALQASEVYGDGDFGDFLQGSGEYAARMKLYAESGLSGTETSQAQISKAIKKAHLFLESERPAKTVGYEVAQPAPAAPKPANGRVTPEQWNGAGVGAPTRRAPEALPNGDAKAIAGVAAKLGKQTTTYDEDAEIKATLLRRGA